MRVRPFRETDMREVVGMARQFHAESPVHAPLAFNEVKVRELIYSSMVSADWQALVAIGSDGLAGFSLCYVMPAYFSDEREAGDLAFYVDPGKRGTRAAQLLLDEILPWASERGARRFNLGIYTGINHETARRFFEKRGLEPTGLMMGVSLPF